MNSPSVSQHRYPHQNESAWSRSEKAIAQKYDYSYSQLDLVFGRFLREKWIGEEDPPGLGEDKLRVIRSYAQFLAQADAVA